MSEPGKRMPRELRTPITEAGAALNYALEFWLELMADTMADRPDLDYAALGDPKASFYKSFDEFFADPATDGDKEADALVACPGNELLRVMFTIIAYSAQAMRAEENNRHEAAWTFAADATYWAGILNAEWAEKMHGESPGSQLAGIRAEMYEALKDEALAWLCQNGGEKLKPEEAGGELWLKYSREASAETYTKWIRADRAKKSK